jgi:hypothetical protein
MIRFKTVLEK